MSTQHDNVTETHTDTDGLSHRDAREYVRHTSHINITYIAQTGRLADRQTNRQTDKDRQTDR